MRVARVVAVIQARVGSTRLPAKVLRTLGGQSVMANVVARVRAADEIDDVVVATTTLPGDDAIADECARLNVDVYRGSESDVLARYLGAAVQSDAAVIVRITSDCPLIDPGVIDDVVRRFAAGDCDYASNTIVRSFPRGLDTEVMSRGALELAAREAKKPEEREHVTLFFHNQSGRFRRCSVQAPHIDGEPSDYSAQRWTLDTAEDFRFLEQVFDRYGIVVGMMPPFRDVAGFVEAHPDIATINADVLQKAPTD